MQRKVIFNRATVAIVERGEDGKLVATEKTVDIMETDIKRATAKAKKIGAVLEVKRMSQMYELDDRVFFEHAEKKGEPVEE